MPSKGVATKVAGTTKLAMKASVHVLASMLRRGTASTHPWTCQWRSTGTCGLWPSEEAGRSTCTWENLNAGTGMAWSGAAAWLLVDLSTLALLAVAAHSCHVFALPDKMGSHHMLGGMYARVGHAGNSVEYCSSVQVSTRGLMMAHPTSHSRLGTVLTVR